MSNIQKAAVASAIFLVLWIGWCFLVIHFVISGVMKLMNIGPEIVGWALMILPFLTFAAGLIFWYVDASKKKK